MTEIPHSKPWITPADEAAVSDVLRSGMIAQGAVTRRFETAVAEWHGCAYAGVATGTGAGALQLALRALGCGPGTEIISPTYTCPTVLEAMVATGATPVLVDAGEDWRPDPVLTRARLTPRTRAIIVPHLFGLRTDLAPFRALGVPVVEDCAQLFGPRSWHAVQGTIAIFSFHPTKCLTTGEGGMALTPDPDLARRMRALRDGEAARSSRWLFSPLSDLAAALGLSQLERYPEFLARRRDLHARYSAALKPVLPEGVAWLDRVPTMHYRFPLRVPGGTDRFAEGFLQQGVHIRRAVDRLLHRSLGRPDSDFPGARRLYDETVSLPIYPALTEAEFTHCLHAATALFAQA